MAVQRDYLLVSEALAEKIIEGIGGILGDEVAWCGCHLLQQSPGSGTAAFVSKRIISQGRASRDFDGVATFPNDLSMEEMSRNAIRETLKPLGLVLSSQHVRFTSSLSYHRSKEVNQLQILFTLHVAYLQRQIPGYVKTPHFANHYFSHIALGHFVDGLIAAGNHGELDIKAIEPFDELQHCVASAKLLNPEVAIAVWVYNQELEGLICEAATHRVLEFDVDYEDSYIGTCFKSRERITAFDFENTKVKFQVKAKEPLCFKNAGRHSGTFFPILASGRCRGAVGFFPRRKGGLSSVFFPFAEYILREIARRVSEWDQFIEITQLRDRITSFTPLLALGTEVSQRHHDIRDAVTSIKLIIEELGQDRRLVTPSRRSQLKEQGLRLVGEIRDTVSKQLSSYRRSRERRRPTDMCDWLKDQDARLRVYANEKEVEFVISTSEQLDASCAIQPFYMQRALENLVSNAVYFARQTSLHRSRVEVGIRKEARNRGNRLVSVIIVYVTDTGPGVSQVPVQRVFDAGETTKPDGYGVGLSIVDSVVRDHKGFCEVSNLPRGGAEFRMCIPELKIDDPLRLTQRSSPS